MKIGIVAGVVAILSTVIFTVTYSSSKDWTLLFQRPLTIEEYGIITAEMEKMNIEFTTRSEKYILVKDEETGQTLRMKLAQAGKMPSTVKGWDLFDMQSWTTTEFERNVNLRRAIEGEMKKHLESIAWIENAEISIPMPKPSLYTKEEAPVEASVILTPSPGNRDMMKNIKVIKGIETIIARGVDGLVSENITINNDKGMRLNDFTDEGIDQKIHQAKEESKLTEQERKKIENKIAESLNGILSRDRYRVTVDLELKFDRITQTQKEILPVVIKPRTPGLPYDDSVVKENVPVSIKTVNENFVGPGFIPEGPPGQEPNIPPGYKEQIEHLSKYNKEENIKNYDNGERKLVMNGDAVDIVKKSVSVVVDGTWEKEVDEEGNPVFEKGKFIRRYIPYPDADLKKLYEAIKGAIAYDARRGDRVVVENISFDREAQFLSEDEAYLRNQRMQWILLVMLFSLLGLFLISATYVFIRREIARRRRIRQRELQRQRQLEQEEALMALEAGAEESAMSSENRRRLDLEERANRLASERPREVAKLVKSWLADTE